MKKIVLFAVAFLVGGCSSSLRSGVADLDLHLQSPLRQGETLLPVIYPYRQEAGGKSEPLAERFGPAWRSLEEEYPEYRFN